MAVVGLDFALQTGVAVDRDGHLYTMVWNLKGDESRPVRDRSIGPAIRLTRHLDILHNQEDIKQLVLENAFTAQAAQAWLQNTLQAAALLWCHRHGVPYSRYAAMTWKKHVLGSGRITRDHYHLLACKKWPELDIQTNDEAAALWLLEMERMQHATEKTT